MLYSEDYNKIFDRAVADYHIADDVDAEVSNPYPQDSYEALLYKKCMIDAVQWHLEDIIRDKEIDPAVALKVKRRIDASNQDRTDRVEQIDEVFLNAFKDIAPLPEATLNTESPAWAIDRLSILALKIWHWKEQAERTDATPEHIAKAKAKLEVLLEQKRDLSEAIDNLLRDYESGRRRMKTYRQMKMYNDPECLLQIKNNK